ncbi:MAG: serine/threonine protein kinase [Candidatus Marinimicrobia bacterium]|jgi:serine/threonine protein kinase|nr:serine/threonine protein kinase [Candidatus Neomarinimicrobiota bacterium]MBT4993934.1 serine/threonine protein kinase [Candidatus Neomarinimicrobiota bacterium]
MINKQSIRVLTKGDLINDTYKIVFYIGEGAFGEVYRVKHKYFDDFQVMKVFKSEYVANTDIKNIFNEGQILSLLNHPNIVKIYEINTFQKSGQSHYFITMSFVGGESLSQLVRRKIQLDVPVATSIMIDVLKGLSVAHNHIPTIVHRDINPDNILLSYDNHKPVGILGDFGIATLMDKVTKLPGAGGRFIYFSPECFMGIYLPTSDVFSAGIVLYKVLTGVQPWEYKFDQYAMDDNDQISRMINSGRRVLPRSPSTFNNNIDKKLDRVILKSLEKNMENRYRTSGEFLDALEKVCEVEDLSQSYWVDQDL